MTLGLIAASAFAVTGGIAPGVDSTMAVWQTTLTIPFPAVGIEMPTFTPDPETEGSLIDSNFQIPPNSSAYATHSVPYTDLYEIVRLDFGYDANWLEGFSAQGLTHQLRLSTTSTNAQTGGVQIVGQSIYVIPSSLQDEALQTVPAGASRLVVPDGVGTVYFTFVVSRGSGGAAASGFVIDPERVYMAVVRPPDGVLSQRAMWIPPMTHPNATVRWDPLRPECYVRPASAPGFANPVFTDGSLPACTAPALSNVVGETADSTAPAAPDTPDSASDGEGSVPEGEGPTDEPAPERGTEAAPAPEAYPKPDDSPTDAVEPEEDQDGPLPEPECDPHHDDAHDP